MKTNKREWEEELKNTKLYKYLLFKGFVKEVKSFISKVESQAYQRAMEETLKEERQFILNVLDGIDEANRQAGFATNTHSIRVCLQGRYAGAKLQALKGEETK